MGLTFRLGQLPTSLFTDASNNVGIGAAPSGTYKLEVTGTAKVSGANYLFTLNGGGTSRIAGTIGNTSGTLDYGLEGSAGGQLFTGAGAYSGNIGTSSATSFNLCTNSTVKATITSAGNFGIGVASPIYKLQIDGDVYMQNNRSLYLANTTTAAGAIRFYNATTSLTKSAIGSYFNIADQGNLEFMTGGETLRMHISSEGYVRIGTSTGSRFLNVYDTLAVRTNRTGTEQEIFAVAPTGSGTNDGYLRLFKNGVANVLIAADNSRGGDTYFNGGGSVGIGNTASPTYKLLVTGGTTDGSTFSFYAFNSANVDLFGIRTDGAIYTGAAGNSPYNLTTGNAANCFINTNGYLYRSTSSLKYKKNVQNYTKGLAEVLQLRPVSYESINEEDAGVKYAGLIAEEVHDLGLTEFVQYRTDRTPDALAYANMIALLTKAIQEQNQTIQELNERLNKAGL